VWTNTPKRATAFYHAKCSFHYVGFDELGKRPCIGLHLGVFQTNTAPDEPTGKWYLFTADSSNRSSDGAFCCKSTMSSGPNTYLGTLNRKFMDDMKYLGSVDFHGDYYDGPAKQYAMAMDSADSHIRRGTLDGVSLPLKVWYETDMQGKPLRFGEIGRNTKIVSDENPIRSVDLPLIWEEMDPSSFGETFSDAVFEIPEVCKTENIRTCAPGPLNYGGGYLWDLAPST